MTQVAQSVKRVKVSTRPKKAPPPRLPWPRKAPEDPTVELGIDVEAKMQDIIKIVYKFFKVPNVSMEELLQEVFLAIIHKNQTRSAHDPRKSSFGHYVYMVANNVCINLVHKNKRHEKERNSLDAPSGPTDERPLLETLVTEPEVDDTRSHIQNVENVMRKRGMWELARYIRTARSGANQDVIREVMSWEGRVVSTKMIREIRMRVRDVLEEQIDVVNEGREALQTSVTIS